MLLLVLSTLLVGLLGLVWLNNSRKRSSTPSKSAAIPGLTPSHPTQGNLTEIGLAGSLPAFLTKLHSEYGDVAGFWFGEVYTVSVCQPHHYRKLERLFDRHPKLFEVIEPLVGHISLQFANGEHGKERYKLLSRPFSQATNQQLLPQVVKVTQGLFQQLPQQLPLHQTMMAVGITTITQCHFGGYCQKEDNVEQLQKAYQLVFDDFDDAILGKWTMGQGDSREHQMGKNLKNFKTIVGDMVRAHRARKDSGEYDAAPFLDNLLDHVDDEEDVISQAITFLVGGFHTTGMFLTFLFYYISLYPEVQEKMRSEIKSVLGDSDLQNYEQLEKLEYVRAVLDETLRLARVAIFSERLLTSELTLDEFKIPAGTQVLNALSVTLWDEKHFPNPETFDPDRPAAKDQGLAHCPFGFGVRKCPGYRLANLEATVGAVEMLKKWRLEADTEEERVQPVFGFIAKPEREIWVTATRI